jgi:riboflavin synthase
MFTGLIEAIGRIERVSTAGSGRRITVAAPFAADLNAGESVAVNGVCLTVATVDAGTFEAVISPETMRVTSFRTASAGRLVNLERPLAADGRLGGHFVLGHVDGTGRVIDLRQDEDCHWLTIETPRALVPYLVPKGSLAIDGISLTVASLDETRVGVQIVPFTFEHTAIQAWSVGDTVNLETDVLGKYVVNLLTQRAVLAGDR